MPLTEEEEIELLELLEEEERDRIRNRHADFMNYTWLKKTEKFVLGFHTSRICDRIDQAFEDFKNGKSTYLLVNVHHRSGKSDIVSRYLGPHFLGEFPDREVMQVTYQSNLAASFSSFGRNIYRSRKYKELYPNYDLSGETNKKNEWVIVDPENKQPTGGRLYSSGLQSGLTGNGFSLGILDDYFRGRAEAESVIQRNNAWDAFTNDFMTRAAPVVIIIILATVWHWDDISGRIRREMEQNPDFPRFEELVFPAKAEDYTGPGTYPGKYLFLERYPETWYKNQYATLGKYSSSALLDCNPQFRTGGVLSTNGIVYYERDEVRKEFPSLTDVQWYRVWDLAHTAKQREKDDPDYTSGTFHAFTMETNDPVPHLWIRDVKRKREGAVKRDELIKIAATTDGPFVKQAVSTSIDSKDAYDYLVKNIPEVSWIEIPVKGDKLVRATPLEPIFEAPGHVHVARGDWNDEWVDEIIRFDGLGKTHDDQVDNLSDGYTLTMFGSMRMSDAQKEALKKRRERERE